MRTLYHLWLSAYSRKVRVALAEKKLEFELQLEKTWHRRPEFLALNPAGKVPVIVEDDGTVLSESTPICEYLDEVYPDRCLIGLDPAGRAEIRRLVNWFDLKFGVEVTHNLVDEKLMKRIIGLGGPDSQAVRAGKHNIHYHLDYIGYLTERRTWLGGDDFSLADITAAAHVSAVDYIGDVPWDEHAPAKDWYARVKSRPSFRALLADHIPGLPPPRDYANLDF